MRTLLSLVSALLMSCMESSAASIVYEGFDLSPGGLTGRGGATSFGFSDTWGPAFGLDGKVVTDSLQPPVSTLSFYAFSPVGNRGMSEVGSIGNSAGMSRLSPHLTFGNTLFGSFLARPSGSGTSSFNLLFLENPNNLSFVARQSTGTWTLLTTSVPITDTGVPYSTDTQLVVFRLDFNVSGTADRVSVWFDRNPISTAADFTTTLEFGIPDLRRVAFTSGNGGTGAANSFEIDEIRLGTTVRDVIPEPSSAALLLLGVTFLGIRTRR